MLCEKCNKHAATVHLTEINPSNVKKEVHLCETCAQQITLPYKLQFSISEILSSLIEPVMNQMLKDTTDVKCPTCGMNYEMFHKKARFGCAQDYEIFKKGIVSILEKIHGSVHHVGKTPQDVSPHILKEKELRDLQHELERLVKSEEFEKAAEVRDKIKKMREKKK